MLNVKKLCWAVAACLMTTTGTVSADPGHGDIPKGIKAVAPWPRISQSVARGQAALMASPAVQQALAFIEADDARTMQETILMTEIPAPEFMEERKAKAFMQLLKDSGLEDVRMDVAGNVMGVRRGSASGPVVVVDAHLDTVFPMETDVTVKKVDGKFYAPGLTDDTRGLAIMLSMVRAMCHADIRTQGTLIVLGSVGEEGNGDLRGVKQFFKDHPGVDAYLGIESIPFGAVVSRNTGSQRFEVTYTGPGGHSFAAFGEVPSAIHALGRAVARIGDLKVPDQPRTTFNVGIIGGGRSVNTIADQATMEIDIRSDGAVELKQVTQQVLAIVRSAADEENRRWGKKTLQVAIKQIGDRPGGMTSPDSVLIQASLAGIRAVGQKELILAAASTNAGIPISLGIPAIQVGPGGKLWGFHALDEGMDPTGAYKGIQAAFLTALNLVGVEGVTPPAMPMRRQSVAHSPRQTGK